MRRYFSSFFIPFLGLWASPSWGCSAPDPSVNLSVIHAELPQALPPDAFVADVQFERRHGGWDELLKGARVRVRQVVQGEYDGDIVIVRDNGGWRIICYNPIKQNGSGFIIGRSVGREDGILVVQPIYSLDTPEGTKLVD